MLDIILSLSKFLYLVTGTLTIGYLTSLIFFAKNQNGLVRVELKPIKHRISILALLWFIFSFIYTIATLADILEISFADAIDFTTLRSFLTQISLGKFLAAQFVGALLISILTSITQRITHLTLILLLALGAVVAPVFESHSASSGSHLVAVGTLIVHVIGLTLWVGGLASILLNKELDRTIALKRFSVMAMWAAITVIVSGVLNGWLRMNFRGAWQGTYAILLSEKLILTLLLLFIANLVRSRFMKQIEVSEKIDRNFTRLVWFELALLTLIVFIGTLLSRSTPPLRNETIDPIEALVGLRFPGKPNLSIWILEYQPDTLILAILILFALLYLKGVRVLKKRGDNWPLARTCSFLVGLFIINYAINGAIGVYSHFAFSYHMIEHMILGMIAPIPLVLSAPITLALRTLPTGRDAEDEGVRNLLIRALHSKYARFLTNPVTALLIFDGSLFALYFTGLFGDLMGSHLGHLFMNVHFLLAGTLFFHVIVGVDPNPNRPPNIVRIVILFAAMSIHAFFSIVLMSATTLLDGGYYQSIGNPLNLDLLQNQYTGGAIGWAMGEIPILIALAAAFIQWMRDDRKETLRIDRDSARASAMGEADDLAKYNRYLAELARNDGRNESNGKK